MTGMAQERPRIAVFSGPTATIGNSPPLVTSDAARRKHGLPASTPPQRFDVLRPQRLAAPVTVLVEAFTAHPLEADAAELYAPPDGWLDTEGVVHERRPAGGGKPVYVVELHPDDGVYPLPYMARQADGSAWEDSTTRPLAPAEEARQTFYPDAGRIYEEVDRLGVWSDGRPAPLGSVADFDFFRAIPSGGYRKGADGVPPERLGHDYFPYYPFHLQREPTLGNLATATNLIQRVLATGRYAGAQWLDGSPNVEESMYWFGLLVDTTRPLVGHSGQRQHQSLGTDGGRNIVDGVKYLVSGAALDEDGRDRIGPVVIVDELAFAARDVAKTDGRPGGYQATGGLGGVVVGLGGYEPPKVGYLPAKRHTYRSEVRLTALPAAVTGVTGSLAGGVTEVAVTTKDEDGGLVPSAMPIVTIAKYSRYAEVATGTELPPDPAVEVEIMARIAGNLRSAPLAGFVAEGMSPYGLTDPTTDAALGLAAFSGMPVVRVGRGNTGGAAYRLNPVFVAGDNLTATKARLLLMATMLKYGSWPPARDPRAPTDDEVAATMKAVRLFQDVFDTH